MGGSTAGAIAAAGAAAAELGRTAGGFELLEALPRDLTAASPAGGSILFRLFQPTKQTYPLYRAFTAGMGKSAKLLRTFFALIPGFWPWALAGAAPGILVLVAIVVSAFDRCLALGAGVFAGLILVLLGTLLGLAGGAVKMLAGVSATGFGLCTGMPGAGAKGADALTARAIIETPNSAATEREPNRVSVRLIVCSARTCSLGGGPNLCVRCGTNLFAFWAFKPPSGRRD